MRVPTLCSALLTLAACSTVPSVNQPSTSPTAQAGSWVFVGRQTEPDGNVTSAYLDRGRMQRTGRSTMRAVVRFDYSPARTEANVMYDSQELDEEFDCSRNTVRTLGVRSFRTQQMVGVGGPVLAGIPMRASGVTAELLTVVCRTVPPPR